MAFSIFILEVETYAINLHCLWILQILQILRILQYLYIIGDATLIGAIQKAEVLAVPNHPHRKQECAQRQVKGT